MKINLQCSRRNLFNRLRLFCMCVIHSKPARGNFSTIGRPSVLGQRGLSYPEAQRDCL